MPNVDTRIVCGVAIQFNHGMNGMEKEHQNRYDAKGRIYHSPYIVKVSVNRPIKVYVQVVRSIGRKEVYSSGVDMSLGDVVVFLDRAACEKSVETANISQGGVKLDTGDGIKFVAGRIELAVGSEIVNPGTDLWRIMAWSEFRHGYVIDETYGTFKNKQDAESVCRAMYEQHRNALAVKEHLSMGKVGIPEPAFVDFEKPNEFKELL